MTETAEHVAVRFRRDDDEDMELTMFSKPKEYDQATQLLKDLHEIARREADTAAFTARMHELRTRYAKRPSLMERFDRAGLPRLE